MNEVKFKTGTRLAEVLEFLPCGIIDKSETGIGATFLEAICKRNSIIVEPTRAIVIDKATSLGCLGFKGGSEKEDLVEYFNLLGDKFKKIFVVSDSVGKLITILKEMGEDVFNDYFYLIDEVEQYQTEASYRGKMGVAIDYYKEFKNTNRAAVTATLYEFSNPVFASEPRIKYSYYEPKKRNVDLKISNNPVLETIETLKKLDDKCLIFFNSVQGIKRIIELGDLPKDECAVYCGEASKEYVKEYYHEFINTPDHKYNFYTSAFFSGVDIYGEYNVITVIDVTIIHTLLYQSKLKQIVGRVRNQVLSDTIISNYTPHLHQRYAEYISDRMRDAEKAMTVIQRNKDIDDNKWFFSIRESIVKQEFDGVMILREDKEGDVVPNYEEIDYKYIHIKAGTDLYSKSSGLKDYLLENGNNVSCTHINRSFSQEQIDKLNAFKEKIKEEREQATEAVYKIIKSHGAIGTFKFDTIDFRQLMYEATGITKKLWAFYNKFHDAEALRESKGEESYFTKYITAYSFDKLSSKHSFKIKMSCSFKFNQRLTPDQIATSMNEIYANELPGTPVLSKRCAVKELKKFYKIKRCKTPLDRIDAYEIIGKKAA